ncbi:MAG: 50S ribosomal protein L32 [Candidatus Improbicoccus pseudotrichonymphae]|uniref:Large ribosomal subunit protein bL32 n=1 Tax=Candidatus Improbicoccus pseudotrichonymphae TaxID=3033792 RepID=A0AA48I1Q3_9FIRM|nr:MAG: 50S ribosomal protein L32 [Candidatus Improbicoccus pseudotrichonymphae]
MAVPKRKTSKARRNKRRSSVNVLTLPNLSVCNHCGNYCVYHRICSSCGYYRGKAVLTIKEKK